MPQSQPCGEDWGDAPPDTATEEVTGDWARTGDT